MDFLFVNFYSDDKMYNILGNNVSLNENIVAYVNKLDSRLGESTWRWSYDYQVVGDRDFSDLDDKDFIRLRRKKNKLVTIMYAIFLIMFVSFMSWLSKFLILVLN